MTDQLTVERLKVFEAMLSTCHKLFLRSYDSDFYSLGDETEEERLAGELFALSKHQTDLLSVLADYKFDIKTLTEDCSEEICEASAKFL